MPEIPTVIVGTKFRGRAAIEAIGQMREGDPVRLERDSGNEHDRNAIQCHFLGLFVGFIPRQANPRIAAAMDAGAQPTTAICTASPVIKAGRVDVEPKIRVTWE